MQVVKPTYRRQKDPKGDRAFVQVDGQRIYLGAYDSPESRRAYERALSEWRSGALTVRRGPDLTILELIAAFWKHVETYYRSPEGKPTSEVANFRAALKGIKTLYGSTMVADFGPRRLQAVREAMIADGWSRRYINGQVQRIKAMFRWGVEQELVDPAVHVALQTVKGLARGRTIAADPEPVRPVDDAIVAATIAQATAVVGAMVELMRLTGMRAGEVCIMRSGDIDTAGDVWVYTPATHKTAWRGKDRRVYLGPRAIEILRPFLRRELEAFLFSPAASAAESLERRSRERETPASCGTRAGDHRKRNRRRAPRERFTPDTLRQSIAYACRRAWPAPPEAGQTPKLIRKWRREHREAALEWDRTHAWHPHQLRHRFATTVRREEGLDEAQLLCGHSKPDMTVHYAQVDDSKARAVARRIG